MKQLTILFLTLVCVAGYQAPLLAHCQVPCGIYNDELRFQLIFEHITTIEKAMKQIGQMAAEKNYNQVVRWVQNKEKHAEELSDIVTYYFMAQRVKPVDPHDKAGFKVYVKKLVLLHQILVYTMKSKQTTDLAHVQKLRMLVKKFKELYMQPKQKRHLHQKHSHQH